MSRCSREMLMAASVLVCALTLAPSAQAESRGELLYSTHCIACHTSQMHWRDKKQATDWGSLKVQVRRWQATAMLGWNEDDILDVTRYLNESFYRFSRTSDPLGSRVGGVDVAGLRGLAAMASISSARQPGAEHRSR